MLKDVLSRIEQRLADTGLAASRASTLAGLSEDAIRNLQRAAKKDDRQGVSTATIFALAPVLGVSPGWLLDGGQPVAKPYVPVLGYVGADNEGTVKYSSGQGTAEEAEAPPGATTAARALLVRGHSMKGYIDDGGILFFELQHTPPRPELLQQICVVETADDDVLVKRLLRGSSAGLYDLESISGPTLKDKRLRWAAPIIASIPPYQAAKILRHASESQIA